MAETGISWRQRRRERKAKKITMFGNAKKAGLGMGREELKAGVEATLRRQFPDRPVRDGSAYVEIHLTRDLDELAEAKERTMREEPPDIVVIFGGDGTTQKTLGEDPDFLRYLTADPERAPEFVVIGGGTKNVVPGSLKLLGRNPLMAFGVVCEKIRRGIPLDNVVCPILKVNKRHGFIYGAGVPVNALDEYYGRAPGWSRAIKAGASIAWRQTLGRMSPWRGPSAFRQFLAAVTARDADGLEAALGEPYSNAILASSLREVYPMLKVTNRAGERLGCFHAIVHGNGFLRAVANLPSMLAGAPLLGNVADAVTDRLVLRYGGPMRHTIDGELYDSTQQLGSAPGEDPETVVIETGPFIRFVLG